MKLNIQTFVLIALVGCGCANSARADGCEVSKKFELKKAQQLSGVLKDPKEAPLPGFQLDLVQNGKPAMTRVTDNNGGYDFGEVPAGKYKIRLSIGGRESGFCAPSVKCTGAGCKINSILKLGPQMTVVM